MRTFIVILSAFITVACTPSDHKLICVDGVTYIRARGGGITLAVNMQNNPIPCTEREDG